MRTLHYFIRDRLLASAPCPDKTLSHVMVCPACGDAWARLAVDPPFEALASCVWVPLSAVCERHAPTYLNPIPGSLLPQLASSADFEGLPMPVLRWECQRHMQTFERIQNEQEDVPGRD